MNKKRSEDGSDIFREMVDVVNLREVLETVREPLVALDKNLAVVMVNEIFCRTFWVLKENIEGKNFFNYGNEQWNILSLKKIALEVLHDGKFIQGYEIKNHFSTVGHKTLLINARRIFQEDNLGKNEPVILIAIEDISEITALVKKFNTQSVQYQLLLERQIIKSKKHLKDLFGLNKVLKGLDMVLLYFSGWLGKLRNRIVIRL
jgi:hypothetical protein